MVLIGFWGNEIYQLILIKVKKKTKKNSNPIFQL